MQFTNGWTRSGNLGHKVNILVVSIGMVDIANAMQERLESSFNDF